MSSNLPIKLTEQLKQILDQGSFAMLVTIVQAPESVGLKLLVDASGAVFGSLADPELDHSVTQYASRFFKSGERIEVLNVSDLASHLSAWKDAKIMLERIEPEPRIVICGAGHVGAALARLAAFVGYQGILIDDRAEFLTRASVPDEKIAFLLADGWYETVRAAIGDGHGISVAVVTRGHSQDEECMRAVMTSNAAYVGLIGSKRRTRIVLERLQQSGANEEQLRKVHAPVGLDIGAVTPEEVALAIMAEVIAVRRGGTGVPLSSYRK